MSLLRKAAPYFAYSFVSFTGLTSRIRWEGLEHVSAARRGGGYIYAFWHQRQVFFTYTHRDMGASVMVSRSADGEIIAETMRLSRIRAVRGSSSRAGSAAALELAARIGGGEIIGLTPDGPKGPPRAVKKGVLFLAMKSGRPIVPISNALSRRVQFERSWDKFQVPLPFGRAAVTHGAPIFVRSESEFGEAAERLRASLDEITARAEALVK